MTPDLGRKPMSVCSLGRISSSVYILIGFICSYQKISVILPSIEEIYSTFVSRVSAGREISPEMVDSIGQGRVWSGVNALDINLVDGYAGLMACINTAAEMAELDKYRIVELPEQKDPFTQIMESFGAQARTDHALKARLGIFYEWYVSVEKVMKQSGIQARMPYEFDLR